MGRGTVSDPVGTRLWLDLSAGVFRYPGGGDGRCPPLRMDPRRQVAEPALTGDRAYPPLGVMLPGARSWGWAMSSAQLFCVWACRSAACRRRRRLTTTTRTAAMTAVSAARQTAPARAAVTCSTTRAMSNVRIDHGRPSGRRDWGDLTRGMVLRQSGCCLSNAPRSWVAREVVGVCPRCLSMASGSAPKLHSARLVVSERPAPRAGGQPAW